MKLSDFRIGFRVLLQERVYSAVVVGGLATGMAAFFLLLSYVQYSFSYNSQAPQAERLYVLKHKMNLLDKPQWTELMPLPFADALQKTGLTDGVSSFVEQASSVVVENRAQPLQLMAVEPAFASMFGIEAEQGDVAEALTRPDAVALTRESAVKLFGSAQAMGRTLRVKGATFTVVALLPDPPSNSTVHYDALLAIRNAAWSEEERQSSYNEWGGLGGSIYFKIKPGVEPGQVTTALQQAVDASPLRSSLPAEMVTNLGDQAVMDVRVGRIDQAYFDKDVIHSMGSGDRGDKRMVLGTLAIALLILLLAVVNYVNLATIRTVRRQREIAIRKVLGASAGRITAQFLAESLIVSLLASVLGLVLTFLLIDSFSNLVNRPLGDSLGLGTVAAGLLVGVIVGLVAGLYPSMIALRQPVAGVVSGRGNSETAGGLALRRALTILQFGTAMALIGVTLGIVWQTHFATTVDPGFDPARFIAIDMDEDMNAASSRAFRDEVARLPGAASVTESMDALGRANPMIGSEEAVSTTAGGRVTVRTVDVGAAYFEALQVQPLAGRVFAADTDDVENASGIVINDAAVRVLGFPSASEAVGKWVSVGLNRVERQIVGVVGDMRQQTLREAAQPMIYGVGKRTVVLIVRGSGDMLALKDAATRLWMQHFPDQLPRINLEQTYFTQRYAEDLRLARLLGVATLIAVLIAAFGVYVLAAYSVQRRSKEIVLRKLYGATSRDILLRLGREIGALIAFSAVIALPIAGFALERYLSGFVERAPMGVWPLVAALLGATLLALLATGRHLLNALATSPAQVLRG